MEANGGATFDFFVDKVDAFDLPDGTPISIWDSEWNEWVVLAEAVLGARAEIEVRVSGDEFDISFDSVDPA